MSLFGSLSLKATKKRDQENGKNGPEGHHPKKTKKAPQITSMTNNGCDSVKGGSH